ncbi:MAG: hypothetical protein JSW64_02285 [Candidatus Zixiibacteriota bacterium]|nr:MAG: hypothetical protein JSW64_02285 [candidate division Zixibacteria bacterium]
MSKVLITLLVISIVANMVGLYILYKYYRSGRVIDDLIDSLESMTEILERKCSTRMVFIHHSVGHGILQQGGLRDSLYEMGIFVKGATYGDNIGNKTDIKHWAPKFRDNMELIISFKTHPDKYYDDGTVNDIIMFKSCFPNSDIIEDGSEPGIPGGEIRSLANYRAAFTALKEEFVRHKDRLFIYMTAPPLVPEATTMEAAARARRFNRWLTEEFVPAYYKEDTGLDNFIVFNLFEVLADEDGFLREGYRLGRPGDSHPNEKANKIVAREFMEFFRPVWAAWQENRGISISYQ